MGSVYMSGFFNENVEILPGERRQGEGFVLDPAGLALRVIPDGEEAVVTLSIEPTIDLIIPGIDHDGVGFGD